jgi:hypothetical protein
VAICISALDIVIGLVERKGGKLSLMKQPGGPFGHSTNQRAFRGGRINGAENYAELRDGRALRGTRRYNWAPPAVLKFTLTLLIQAFKHLLTRGRKKWSSPEGSVISLVT